MDKAAVTSAPFPLRLGKHELSMRPMRDVDIGELDNWVRGRYVQTVRDTLEGLSDSERRESLQIAFDRASLLTAFAAPGSAILATPEGLAKLVQLACRSDVPWTELHQLMFDPQNAEAVRMAFAALNPAPKNAASRTQGPATASRRKKSTRGSRRSAG